jgi:hypothetical protein
MYGFTTINGKFIRTGRIESSGGGSTYFDIDEGIISGNIRFLSSGIETDLGDWAEDIDSDIQGAKDAAAAAQTTADTANTAVGNLNGYVDGAFKDGVIEASEAKAIEKYINIVNTEKSNLEATYNTLYANTYLEGTPKANLLNAKITYFGAVDNLINSINTAIANGMTTVAEKQDVDAKYASYKTALASLQTAIENANKAIQTKLDTLSTQKVDNLQIGGRNLVLNSESRTVTAGESNYAYTEICSNLEEGKQYTLSVEATLISGTAVSFNVRLYDLNTNVGSNIGATLPINAGKVVWTFTTPTDGRRYELLLYAGLAGATANNVVRFDHIKLESGNKATDWTPAPEDVQAEIDNASTTAQSALSAANTAQATADGKITTYYQPSAPTGASEGDIWFDTDDGNKIYTYRSGTWVNTQDSKIAQAINSAQTAQTTADGKAKVYYQTSAPTGMTANDKGDMWVATNANNKLYIYSGTAWVVAQDYYAALIAAQNAQTTANSAQTTASDALAKANTSKAITDKFGTTVDGGLIQSVTMLLRELNSTDETAGISGIRGSNRDLPAFWTGTYADAIAGTAGIIFRHNSTGKVGVLDVDANGNVIIRDVSDTTLIRLMFSKSNIPTVADILSTTLAGGTVTNSNAIYTTSGSTTLINYITVTKDSSKLTFSGTITINAKLDTPHGYTSGYALVEIILIKDDSTYATLFSIGEVLEEQYPSTSGSFIVNKELIVGVGVYKIQVRRLFENTRIASGGISGISTLAWSFIKDIRRFEFGIDGFMAWYTNNHMHFSENGGLDVRGATNIPGVLLAGEVVYTGGFTSSWGAKKHASSTAVKIATGQYRVYHSIGHMDYQVQITPTSSNRTSYISAKGTDNFVVYFYSVGSSPALSDTGFHFMITGRNY